MIIDSLKNELSETAQEKVRSIVEQTVEKKIQTEMKKVKRRLAIKFVITGVAVVCAIVAVNNTGKIMDILNKKIKR